MINFSQWHSNLFEPASSDNNRSQNPAVIEIAGPNHKIVSFAELENLIDNACTAYIANGIGKQDKLVLWQKNSAEAIACLFATWKIGAVAIPIDFRLTSKEVENICLKMGAKAVVTTNELSAATKRLDPSQFKQEKKPAKIDIELDPQAAALIILTSGTTGIPKGAVHPLGSLCTNIQELCQIMEFNAKTRFVIPVPITHIIGLECMLAALTVGGAAIFEDFSPAAFLSTTAKHEPTIMVGVPTIYGALLAMPHVEKTVHVIENFLCGGAPLPKTLAEEFSKHFNKRLVQGYGATEMQIVTVNKHGPVESVGKPVPTCTINVVDSEGQVLPDSAVGEIVVHGPTVMQGYFGQKELTAEAIRNGRYYTGDLGFIKDDHVFISGRSKEMIIVAGNKIFPVEVETVLRQHPLAAEVAVVGPKHARLGQIVKAIVVVREGELGSKLTQDEESQKQARQELIKSFRDFCQEHLKRELRPMEWEFRPIDTPLPKTLSGKVDRKLLEPQEIERQKV